MISARKFLWTVAAAMSAAVALFSYRYLGTSPTRSPEVLANAHATPWLVLHVVGSATALLFGALQLLPRVRRRWPWVHRWIGRLYASGCLLGGTGGLVMAFGSTAGPWATLGFGGLAIAWLGTTVMAWRTAIARNFIAHRAWAIRSWSLTFAAVTFRLCLPIFPLIGLPFVEGYRAASIYAWLINLGVAEWVVRRSRRDAPGRNREAAGIKRLTPIFDADGEAPSRPLPRRPAKAPYAARRSAHASSNRGQGREPGVRALRQESQTGCLPR